MSKIKIVGVRKLKDQLSAYLNEVKTGTKILVTVHSEVVAELKKPSPETVASRFNPQYAEWVEKGWIKPSLLKKKSLPKLNIKLKGGVTSTQLLHEDREER